MSTVDTDHMPVNQDALLHCGHRYGWLYAKAAYHEEACAILMRKVAFRHHHPTFLDHPQSTRECTLVLVAASSAHSLLTQIAHVRLLRPDLAIFLATAIMSP